MHAHAALGSRHPWLAGTPALWLLINLHCSCIQALHRLLPAWGGAHSQKPRLAQLPRGSTAAAGGGLHACIQTHRDGLGVF